MDHNVGRVVFGSYEGVLNPWVTAPLAMGKGQLWVLVSRCIQKGGEGSVPTSSLVMPLVMGLCGPDTHWVNYEAMVPILGPP